MFTPMLQHPSEQVKKNHRTKQHIPTTTASTITSTLNNNNSHFQLSEQFNAAQIESQSKQANLIARDILSLEKVTNQAYHNPLANDSSHQHLQDQPQLTQSMAKKQNKQNGQKAQQIQQQQVQQQFYQQNLIDDGQKQQLPQQAKKKQKLKQSETNHSNSAYPTMKGIKIYFEGKMVMDSFRNRDMGTAETLFAASTGNQAHSTSAAHNVSCTAGNHYPGSSSDEDKTAGKPPDLAESMRYFATHQDLEGPDPCTLDPPSFSFQ